MTVAGDRGRRPHDAHRVAAVLCAAVLLASSTGATGDPPARGASPNGPAARASAAARIAPVGPAFEPQSGTAGPANPMEHPSQAPAQAVGPGQQQPAAYARAWTAGSGVGAALRGVARRSPRRGARTRHQGRNGAAGLRGSAAAAGRRGARPHAGRVHPVARRVPDAPPDEGAGARHARRARSASPAAHAGRQRSTACRPTCSRRCGQSNRTWGASAACGPTIQALATLAWEGRRADVLPGRAARRAGRSSTRRRRARARSRGRGQARSASRSSCRPAYLRYAQDFDGDGRRDIWRSLPDVFASIANYLKEHGWTPGEAWGREVHVTAAGDAIAAAAPLRIEGCRAFREMSEPLPLARWSELGVRTTTR